MWKQVLALNDPVLVARFQQYCGIEFIDSKQSDKAEFEDDEEKSADKSSSVTSNGNHHVTQNGSCSLDNGFSTPSSDSAVRQRMAQSESSSHTSNGHVHSNGFLGNGKSPSNGDVIGSYSKEPQPLLLVSQETDDAEKEEEKRSESIRHQSMDNNVEFRIANKFLYYLFTFGATLGNESFNCFFFAHWIWNVDGYVCRRIILLWALILYVGQVAKDVIRWPRPTSPPSAKLEKRYAMEYGMPSTHAMVAVAMPTATMWFTVNRYIYPTSGALLFCIAWCSLVCFSRIYLGMHSVLDVLVGIFASVILTAILIPWLDVIDDFQVMHPWGGPIMVIVLLILCLCYPTIEHWNTCRGDTVMIIGVPAGTAMAAWLSYQQGMLKKTNIAPPYVVKTPDMDFVISTLLRFIVGFFLLIVTREVFRRLVYRSMCKLWSLDPRCPESKKRFRVELPLKYITYIAISFNLIYTTPLIFRWLGIERETIFTEL